MPRTRCSASADDPVQLTRDAIEVARAYMDLPANERAQFRRAIAGRAFDWTEPDARPAVWPMRLQIVRDPTL
jgi:hypothetical protein